MNYKEIAKIMKNLKWRSSVDEVNVRFFEHDLGDRYITAIPGILKPTGGVRVSFGCVISARNFDVVVAKIRNEKKSDGAGILLRKSPSVSCSGAEIGEKEISECANEMIEWGKQQDLDELLEKCCQYPTDSVGARPVFHLAALAMKGKLDILEDYLRSFQKGNRLGFVPYITIDYIERAIEVGKELQEKPST